MLTLLSSCLPTTYKEEFCSLHFMGNFRPTTWPDELFVWVLFTHEVRREMVVFFALDEQVYDKSGG